VEAIKKMKTPKFSLIICGYNEEENLDTCIVSCLNQDYPKKDYEIIYVDNNSKDNSLKIAKKYPIKVLIEKKQGPSEARNLGIKNSMGEIILFLDSDTKLNPKYLKNQEKIFKNEEVGASGGMVLPLIKTWISEYLGVSLLERYRRQIKPQFVRNHPSCNLSVRKKVLKEVGSFKENFENGAIEIPKLEDKELCERIAKKHKISYNPKSIVYHKNRYKFKDLFISWLKGSKSRAYLIKLKKNDPVSLLFRWNIPLIYLLLSITFFFERNYFSTGLLFFGAIGIFILCINAFIETRMFFQSFFIKPWMDILSLIVTNLGVAYYRLKK